jgi:hypothetical protein
MDERIKVEITGRVDREIEEAVQWADSQSFPAGEEVAEALYATPI